MRKYLLPQEGNFYKANLHSHSTISDGKLTPQEMKDLYKSHGYSILAYTDHDLFIPHHNLTDESFLALSGFEAAFNENNLFPGNKKLKTCHLCFIAKSPEMDLQPCWNPKYAYVGNAKKNHDKIKFDKTTSPFERDYSPVGINKMIKAGRDAGFFVTYNHPSWSLENFEQYTKYEGMHAMEIFNYGCEVVGYPSYVPNIYDDMLRSGKKIFAVAVDDNHNKDNPESQYADSFGGYIMVKAENLKYETITDALFAGNFYASNGPSIYDLYIEGNKIYVTCSNVVMITLNKNARRPSSVIANEGETVNTASFPFEDDDVYLRITIKDSRGRYANSNAYFLEDLK